MCKVTVEVIEEVEALQAGVWDVEVVKGVMRQSPSVLELRNQRAAPEQTVISSTHPDQNG